MNPEQLRHALNRRNEATHPVELPPEPTYVANRDATWHEGDPCEVCHVAEADPWDPIGHFVDPSRPGEYVMAHGDCGSANGLELA